MKHWEEIQIDYLNGNISDAKEKLYQQSKLAILKVVYEALENHISLTGTDLEDLFHLLQTFIFIKGK